MSTRHSLLAALVAVIWGVNFLAIDLGLRDSPPLVLLALRFALVAVPLVFVVPRPDVPWRTLLALGGFMSVGQFALLFTAMHLGLPTGLAPIVLQSQMIFTIAIAAIVLRERPSRVQLLGAAVGLAGLAVVGAGRVDGAGAAALVPLALCLAAALSWGIGNVVARSAPPSNGLGLVVWSALVVPVPALAASLVVDGPAAVGEAFTTLGWETAVSVAYTAGAASLVGYSIWNALLSRYPAADVVPFTLLVPPVGMAAAWLVLGESPNALELAGSVLLVAGVAVPTLVDLRSRRARRRAAAVPGAVRPEPPEAQGAATRRSSAPAPG
ncbi:EamA family transporter [Agromyces sp. SYSU T00194]|uniref:EamA family transporter n=1 Tax=Agromyces chitinivorans TaxID=3158560 RepID=UPI00339A1926